MNRVVSWALQSSPRRRRHGRRQHPAGQPLRLGLDGERVVGEERLIEGRLPYIRDVRRGPDGLLYLVPHGDDGGLFRLELA
jgi:glucose/arabinose dehydrogenase